MKKNKHSATAEGVAIMRAIESSKPASQRLFYDPISRLLIPSYKFYFSKWFIELGFYEKLSPGAALFIGLRERYIDDFLIAALSDGAGQVVILGAGFDTRAYRIPNILKARIFEVDHPLTQTIKIQLIKKAVKDISPQISFVPADFNKDNLAEKLHSYGYRENIKTVFILQGVIEYLTQEGVDNTLGFVANNSCAGSSLIFDYFYNETIRSARLQKEKKILRAIGELILFGIDKDGLEKFMTERGFSKIFKADGEYLKSRYSKETNSWGPLVQGVAIASAEIQK